MQYIKYCVKRVKVDVSKGLWLAPSSLQLHRCWFIWFCNLDMSRRVNSLHILCVTSANSVTSDTKMFFHQFILYKLQNTALQERNNVYTNIECQQMCIKKQFSDLQNSAFSKCVFLFHVLKFWNCGKFSRFFGSQQYYVNSGVKIVTPKLF